MPDYGVRFDSSPISVNLRDSPKLVSIKTEDSVSYVCGTGDGLTYCGPRTITFHDSVTDL
jgi:hypothetical protein